MDNFPSFQTHFLSYLLCNTCYSDQTKLLIMFILYKTVIIQYSAQPTKYVTIQKVAL